MKYIALYLITAALLCSCASWNIKPGSVTALTEASATYALDNEEDAAKKKKLADAMKKAADALRTLETDTISTDQLRNIINTALPQNQAEAKLVIKVVLVIVASNAPTNPAPGQVKEFLVDIANGLEFAAEGVQ